MDRGEADDEVLGIITRDEALERAREEGVDLVMIAEKSDPPVCKIVDYGKLRYQKDKKKKEQAKKAKTNEIKEVKTCVEINQCVGCTQASRRRRGGRRGDSGRTRRKFDFHTAPTPPHSTTTSSGAASAPRSARSTDAPSPWSSGTTSAVGAPASRQRAATRSSSRRRGSWQQRQPLSQCSHSASRRCRYARPWPRKPSNSRRRPTESWRSSSIPCTATRTSS